MSTPSLSACPACAGFVPAGRPTCPHCDADVRGAAPRRRGVLGRTLARLAGAASVVSLMACYGAMMHHETAPPPYPGCVDEDGDGACADADCDDRDATVIEGCAPPEAGLDDVEPAAVATDPA